MTSPGMPDRSGGGHQAGRPVSPLEIELTLFQAAFWILFGLSFPDPRIAFHGQFEPMLLVCAWAGAGALTAFSFMSSSGMTISLLPCLQVMFALTGFTRMIEIAWTASVFTGTMAFSIRTGGDTAESARRSARAALVSWASLRSAAFVCGRLHSGGFASPADAIPAAVAGMTAVQIAATLLRGVGAAGRYLELDVPLRRMVHNLIMPLLFCPLLLPAVWRLTGTETAVKSGALESLLAGVASLTAAQAALTTLLERAKWSQGRALISERAMARLSQKLAVASSTLEALQALAREAFTALHPSLIRVTWGGISLTSPAGGPPPEGRPLRKSGRSGLLIDLWPNPFTILDSARMDSFISQTEAALQNLDLRLSVDREAWQCMEVMVYSLDRSDHRLAGHSKRVARLALETGRRMNLQPGLLDSLRMSALLHHVAPLVLSEKQDEELVRGDISLTRFRLPDDALAGVTGLSEHFDGTGLPSGLRGESIPVQARILAAADEYVTELERSDPATAAGALRMRSGTLYDPVIVEVMLDMLAQGFEA
ncbi:hypothetical protein GX411_04255 [Candidatus Fermentibacteria bacterium]|nr:hypothetical protein [Candidatus Fermentibacteria bacterium]